MERENTEHEVVESEEQNSQEQQAAQNEQVTPTTEEDSSVVVENENQNSEENTFAHENVEEKKGGSPALDSEFVTQDGSDSEVEASDEESESEPTQPEVQKETNTEESKKPSIPLLNIDKAHLAQQATENTAASTASSNPKSTASTQKSATKPSSATQAKRKIQARPATKPETNTKVSLSAASDAYLYEKIVQLENEVIAQQKSIDGLFYEKTQLEKMVKMKEVSLAKTASELETQSDKVKKLTQQMNMKDIKIKELEKQKDPMLEVSMVKKLAESRGEKDDLRTKVRRDQIRALPEETLDKIVLMENELKLKNQKIDALSAEIRTLNTIASKREKSMEEMIRKLDDARFREDRAIKLEAANAELSLMVEKFAKEIKTLSVVQKTKTGTIEKLSSQVDHLKSAKEEVKEMLKIMESKDKRIMELENELSLAQKTSDIKEKEIQKIVSEKDIIAVKSLEGDKRFLQSEIKRLTEKLEKNEVTIRWQQEQMDKLNARLDSVTVALRETRVDRMIKKVQMEMTDAAEQPEPLDPQAPVVSEALYILLEKDLDSVRKLLAEKEQVCTDKDLIIEALEKRVDVLEKAKKSEERGYKRKIAEYAAMLDALKSDLQGQESLYKAKEYELKKEKFAWQKKAMKTAAQPNSQTSPTKG